LRSGACKAASAGAAAGTDPMKYWMVFFDTTAPR